MTRSHGGRGELADDAWTSSARTPLLYPDAVTLIPSLEIPDLLARLDVSEGCTIKDSFASLDLAPHGFRVLFDAGWIAASSPPDGNGSAGPSDWRQTDWRQIAEPAGLSQWEEAWVESGGLAGLFVPDLLLDESVAIVASFRGDAIAAGAVLYRHSGVVGVSNVFTRLGSPSDTWLGLMNCVHALFPTQPLVGYESGDPLLQARKSGFQMVGSLRIWIADCSWPS